MCITGQILLDSAITWVISERMHKIRCELVVLRFVEDAHFFHKCKQGDYLTSNKRVFDNCAHFFILDIKGGISHSRTMYEHMIYSVQDVIGDPVLQILHSLQKTFVLHWFFSRVNACIYIIICSNLSTIK